MTDFVHDLETELLAAARRRATRRPLPRIAWRPLAIAAAALALLVAVALTLRPSEHPATPKPGAFMPPLAPPITACDGTPKEIPSLAVADIPRRHPPRALTGALAVLRRPYERADQLIVAAAPLEKWLPIGDFDDKAVRSASVPATYIVPTGDLRTKPLDCGASTSRGPGACLVMPAGFACFTLGEIRSGRAFAREGMHLVGVVPDGVRWVRLGGIAALADGNVVHVVGKVWPFKVTFEHEVPPVLVLNATATPGRATRLVDQLLPVLGGHAQAGNAARQAEGSAVIAVRPRDAAFARALARFIGVTLLGPADMARRFGAPEDAGVVVVLGTRMR